MDRNHSQQENFVPLKEGMLAGRSKLEIIATHFGISAADIRSIEVWEDVCHLGLFVNRLVVKGQHGRRSDDPAA